MPEISALPPIVTLVPGTDVLAIVSGGDTRKVTPTALSRQVVVVVPIDFLDASGNVLDSNGDTIVIPANSLITRRDIIETTPWDAITSFEMGWSGDGDALITNAMHGLTGDDPTTIDIPVLTTVQQTITVTWNQGAATQGVGYVIVTYVRLN